MAIDAQFASDAPVRQIYDCDSFYINTVRGTHRKMSAKYTRQNEILRKVLLLQEIYFFGFLSKLRKCLENSIKLYFEMCM